MFIDGMTMLIAEVLLFLMAAGIIVSLYEKGLRGLSVATTAL